MEENKKKSGIYKKVVRWLIGILVLAVVAAAFFIGMNLSSKPNTTISSTILESRMEGISELATVSFMYRDMGVFENFNQFYGIQIPFSKKSFIIMYDGIIKAGVDMSQVKFDVKGNDIEVKMPAAKILSHEMDEGSMKIYDEKKSIFNSFSVTDYKSFFEDQKDSVEKKAYEKGVIEEAAKKAEGYITDVIKSIAGDRAEEINVRFTYAEGSSK